MSSLDLLDAIEAHEDAVRFAEEDKKRKEYQESLIPKAGIVAINEKGKFGLIQKGNKKYGYDGIFLESTIKAGWHSDNPKCIFDIKDKIAKYKLYHM